MTKPDTLRGLGDGATDEGLRTALGRLLFEDKVGAGGMGVVYRARDADTGRRVAVKLLRAESDTERARFQREARVMRSIAHPNVVRYLEHGTTPEGQDFLVMEWLEGCDLAARLVSGPLSVPDALALVSAAARGLAAVHAAGVVHRDIKPSNLFLAGGRVDDVRVMDFGISRALEANTRLTASGAVIGTPHYMAPEQLRGKVDVRSDVYGLGATLFESLAGRPPFLADSPSALVLAVLAEAVPNLAAFRAGVSEAVDALVGRMLAKDARDRPADMQAVVTEIASLLERLSRTESRRAILSRAERAPWKSAQTLRATSLDWETAELDAPRTPPEVTSVPGVDGTGEPGEGALVGRARVLAELAGILDESGEEDLATLALVTGDSGIGKSAVLQAVADMAAARHPAWTCLGARAARERTGVPFSVLRSLVLADAARGAPLELRDRLAAQLAALGAGWSAAPRIDPLVEADRLALGWLDLLEHWSERGPLLLLVDDAHLSDLATLRFLERALEHLSERPFVVVMTSLTERGVSLAARPESGWHKAHIHLGPLRPQAASRLAARWAAGAPVEDGQRIAHLSAGNPAHLFALARELREGFGLASRSLAQVVWTRIERLGPDERRTLRAASIVGQEVWPSALAHLLGVARDDPGLARQLATLVGEGYLRPGASRGLGEEAPFEFASELVHQAAYASCTEADLRLGHAEMSGWPPSAALFGAAALARHLAGAGDAAGASRAYLGAARAALAAGDATLFDEYLELASSAAATGEASGEAMALRAQGQYWRGSLRTGLALAKDARSHFKPGSEPWFHASSLAITAAGQLGDNAEMQRLGDESVQVAPLDESAADKRLVAICRVLTQLASIDLQAGTTLLAALDGIDPETRAADTRAWLHRVPAIRSARHHFEATLSSFAKAHRAYIEGDDPRSAALMSLFIASNYTWYGAWERARAVTEEALRVSRRLGADYLVVWASYTEAKALSETAPWSEARAALERVIADTAQSPRLRAGALVFAASAAFRAGLFELAAGYAERAIGTHSTREIVVGATALRCRSLLEQGRLAEALELRGALAAASGGARTLEFDEVVRLAQAELLWALGEADEARRAIRAALEAIEERASTIADVLQRNQYLARPYAVVATFRRAREWSA